MSGLPPPPFPSVEPTPPSVPNQKTPAAMIWALVLSFFGLLIIPLFASVALVIAGWKKAGAAGKGKGLGVAALAVNGIWVLLFVVGVISGGNTTEETATDVSVEATPDDTLTEPANETEVDPKAEFAISTVKERYEADCFSALGSAPQYRYEESVEGLREGFVYVSVGGDVLQFSVGVLKAGGFGTFPHNAFTIAQLESVGC